MRALQRWRYLVGNYLERMDLLGLSSSKRE